jgi:hypothetical protein
MENGTSQISGSTAVLGDVTVIDSPGNQLITQRNGDTVLDFDVAFDMFVASTGKTWAHDRSQTVGASEVWACLRSVWYEKRGAEFGIEPDEQDAGNWGAMERGNLIENHFVVPGLRLALPKMESLPEGVELILGGSDQQTLVLGKNSATPDGIIKGLTPGPLTIRGGKQEIYIEDIEADCIVLEIKSIDPRSTLLEEKARHHGQTQVQLGLIREMTSFKPIYAVVLYVDASFLTMTPFVVKFDPDSYAIAKTRAIDVYRINDPLMIIPEGRFTGACENCRWRGPCRTTTIGSIPKKKVSLPEAIAATDPLVLDYLAAKKVYDEAELRVEVLKEKIKESLMDFQTSSLTGKNWRATWYPVKGKKKLDQEAMKADGIDLEPYQTEGAPHDQLRVTEHLPDTAEKKPRKGKAQKESE